MLSVLEDRQALGKVEMLRKDHTWGFIGEKIVTPGPLGRLVRSLKMNMQARLNLEYPWAQALHYADGTKVQRMGNDPIGKTPLVCKARGWGGRTVCSGLVSPHSWNVMCTSGALPLRL